MGEPESFEWVLKLLGLESGPVLPPGGGKNTTVGSNPPISHEIPYQLPENKVLDINLTEYYSQVNSTFEIKRSCSWNNP